MTHVITHPELHGKTYHLTPQQPVLARLLAEIFEEAIGFYAVSLVGSEKPVAGLTEYEQLFCELISVYSSYWKDDPAFDATNTRTAAPHLPCPHVGRKLLLKMAEYATRVNFTSPRAKPIEPKFDVSAALEPFVETSPPDATIGKDMVRLGLRVTGHGGGDWSLVVNGEGIAGADMGIHAACSAVVECNVDTFARLVKSVAAVEPALIHGDLVVKGNSNVRPHVVAAFRQLADSGRSQARAASGQARALASN
jgi:hypothetical protein